MLPCTFYRILIMKEVKMNQELKEPKYNLSNVLRKKYTEITLFRTALLVESDSTSELLLEAAEELERKDEVIEKNNLEIYELNKVIGEMDDIIARLESRLESGTRMF